MSPYPQTTSFTDYSYTLNKGEYPCQVVISMKKYWLLSQFNWSWNSPCDLENCGLLNWLSHLAIWTPVSEPVLVDLFEVKEENKDLDADSQTEGSETKGGLQEEASI